MARSFQAPLPYPVCSTCCVPLPVSCLQRLLCGFASILCTVAAVWNFAYPVYSACCVVLLESHVQRWLHGIAPILFTALDV